MKRILVVEDSRTQAEAARAILQSAGYEVELAASGEEGLQRIERDRFDLVVSDIVMPGISGYDLCRSIKSHGRTRHLPVVLLTMLNDPMDIIRGLEAGADNFITKPYEPQYVIERISTLLQNKALRAEGKLQVGVDIVFMGTRFNITSEKEQILDLLIATFEDIVRTNRNLQVTQAELASAKAKIEEYARALEGRVRLSEEKYRNLMEQANDAILIIGTDGELREVNRRAEQLLQRSRDELVGEEINTFLPLNLAVRSEPLSPESAVVQSEIELLRPDETRRALEYSISRTQADQEELLFAIVRDVTEKKLLEESIHSAQKLEAVARLASGAAHDFNNVLMGILSFTDVLLRQISGDHPARKVADQILKAGKRGSWLTKQLLAFARSRRRAAVVSDANAVLEDLGEMLRRLVGENIEIVMNLQAEPATVNLEPGQIEQIAMNLVVNARDAMPGRGTITVETRSVHSDVAEQPNLGAGTYTVISVRDTGQGMNQETADRLFQPFFTTKQPGRGTGLGLSIVQTIVQESGGRITVSSEIGKGSVFMVYLPLAEVAEISPTEVRGSESILVIHREESIRALIGETLIANGYEVHQAASVHELPTAADRANLIILDTEMPQLNVRNIPVLRLAADLERDGERRDGSSAAVIPRLNVEELLAKIRELLDASKNAS